MTRERRTQVFTAAAVSAATLVCFIPALENGFVNYDDPALLLDNPYYRGLGWRQLHWAFTTLRMGIYKPITWVTYSLDYALWGLDPRGYHLTSVLFHVANAALFFYLSFFLFRQAGLGGGRRLRENCAGAAFAALFFSAHPLRAESVAWATERRDVVSGLFYLLSLIAYMRAHRDPEIGERRAPAAGVRRLAAAFLFFVAAMLSKATVVFLPIVLLMLDVYPLGRLPSDFRRWLETRHRGVLWEKIPFLAAGAAIAAITFYGFSVVDPTMPTLGEFGLSARAAHAVFGLTFYLGKTLWPFELLAFYEPPANMSLLSGAIVARAGAVAVVAVVAWTLRGRRPAFLWACIYYSLTLLPVLGVAKFGHHVAADRYSYLACMAWAVLAGGALCAGLIRWKGAARNGLAAAAAALLAALGVMTWKQTGVWRNSETLWGHAAAADPRHRKAHLLLAIGRQTEGRFGEAAAALRPILEAYPDFEEAVFLMGTIAKDGKRPQEALEFFRRAAALQPKWILAHVHAGECLEDMGRWEEAVGEYRIASGITKEAYFAHSTAQARHRLGIALARLGRKEEGAAELRAALDLRPEHPPTLFALGAVLMEIGRFEEAASRFESLARLAPDNFDARLRLGESLLKAGRPKEAREQLLHAARLKPGTRGGVPETLLPR